MHRHPDLRNGDDIVRYYIASRGEAFHQSVSCWAVNQCSGDSFACYVCAGTVGVADAVRIVQRFVNRI